MHLIRFILVVISVVLLYSCEKKDCLTSSGKQTSELRILGSFHKIELYNYFNVYLKSDTVNQIRIESGENQLINIETSIKDSTLTIKDNNACGFIKGYAEKNLYISFDSLTQVIVYDGLKLYSIDTLHVGDLLVKFVSDIGFADLTLDCHVINFQSWYASGEFTLRGKANYLYLDSEYLSFSDASQLKTQSCFVNNNSMDDCYVNTSGDLTILIWDEGDIYYTGNPSKIIVQEKSGTGKLIKND